MASTTTWSITYPTTANSITPLATHFANVANTADTALTALYNRSARLAGTNAQRLALVAPMLKEGLQYYATDTDKNWLYESGAWHNADNGLYIITPSAAPSGYSIASDGSLVASNLSTGRRNFDNIFSSRYRNYRLEINLSGKANGGSTSVVVGRSGGADVTASLHWRTIMGIGDGSGALTPVYAAFGGEGNFGNAADELGTINFTTLEIGTPFISTEYTNILVRSMFRGGLFGDRIKSSSLEQMSSVTGLGIDFGQTVASVRIRFYGYR